MCGITGIISRSPINLSQVDAVARLNDLLTHRGPDGDGHLRADHLCMAMRRLSIIDLSTGWQPLYNEDRTLALICNGEVYNFVELRKSLESRGHRFATKSDCETILHLYEDHGDDCVQHLRGMYAFALWDSRRRRLLVVRDRMGEKPLYLVERDGELIFCSELRALVQAGVLPMELDPGAIHEYFHFGFVPEPRCPLKGVRKLRAGHLLAIDVDPWRVEERCYWRLEDSPPIEGDPPTLIRAELERISELIIRSDVPVGVALSGGLDSSIIATLAQKNYPGTMQAITIGYEGTPWQDERAMARELAAHLKMPIHEVELTCQDMVDTFAQMSLDRDEPIDDSAATGLWMIMRKAREVGLPVMLGGIGGDELFWGYSWVRAAAAATRRRQAALGGNGRVIGLRDYLAVSRPPLSYTGGVRWLTSLGGLRDGLSNWRKDRGADPRRMLFYDQHAGFAEALRTGNSLYSDGFARIASATDPLTRFDHDQPWPNLDVTMIRMICDTFLRGDAIPLGDRLSMAWSVEMRLPLVDSRLAEIVVGLTKTQASVAGSPKKWLRDAVKDVLPSFVMCRRKRGFSSPWRQWGSALKRSHGERLPGGFLVQHGVLNEQAAQRLSRWLHRPPLAMPRVMASRALVLETWCGMLDESSRSMRVSPSEPSAGVSRRPLEPAR
jgi:asparagine synthase (glutamine-hydrolysing)